MTQWGLDTLFNPAKRHMDDEKRRLQSTREEVGDNSGGKRIDLNSGKVVIHRAADDDTSEADADAPEASTSESASASEPDGDEDASGAGQRSPAAQRAAKRRAARRGTRASR